MKSRLFLLIVLHTSVCLSQSKLDTWCFGASAKMKFVGGNLMSFDSSSTYSQEQGTSISDESGNLIFYVANNYFLEGANFYSVWGSNNQLILGGDSLMGNTSTTNGLLILPYVGDTNKFYILCVTNGPYHGLRFSLVDKSYNSGNGQVIIRDSLLNNIWFAEKLCATKHANGRDWWVLTHQSSISTDSTNLFYKYLIDSSGIHFVDSQSIGSYYTYLTQPYGRGITGEMVFSEDGLKIAAVGNSLIDLFSFDRCTGSIGNYLSLTQTPLQSPDDDYYGCSFSASGSKLFVSNSGTLGNGHIYQFDLGAVDILSSKISIYDIVNTPLLGIGQHQIGPNGKIYISCFFDGFPSYTDTIYNKNLSVIESPDTFGLNCNIQMFSIPIGSGKSLGGLPNMPNYYLGTSEVNCDSINKVTNITTLNNEILIYPNPFSSCVSIQTNYEIRSIQIFNFIGDLIFFKETNIKNFNFSNFPAGIFDIRITTRNNDVVDKILLKE